ncbi:hypothetical protein GOP47_0009675 [Adiantum capillus-veneris]|uniref:Uncharacterized protein n=1 Tax=Adiantum capillus-veneris TaxID=13818 RepID=A0A9D4UXA4_ADICA|nr:hypothetical protein GOP47_0009675 [Adiantum capillus-veneris]
MQSLALSLQRIRSLGSDDGGDHDIKHDDDEGVNRLHGFVRADMYKDALRGTVRPYQQHVFLCFGDPGNWPPIIETSSSPTLDLPRLLAASLKANKDRLPKKTLFNVCQGSAGDIEALKGDVLVFPSMIKFKDFGCHDINGFVAKVLTLEEDWQQARVEQLDGYHIFVCAHGSRDMRCGVCGPALIQRFEKEIGFRGLDSTVHVRACSHVGGHKFAGNVLIYGKDSKGKFRGHWYGYVNPSDVAVLLDEHIKKDQVLYGLWRGEMSCAEQ